MQANEEVIKRGIEMLRERLAQQRERERHAEAMTARDARVQELQVALARAEAVAEESSQARDKLVAELAHLRLQNEQVV